MSYTDIGTDTTEVTRITNTKSEKSLRSVAMRKNDGAICIFVDDYFDFHPRQYELTGFNYKGGCRGGTP